MFLLLLIKVVGIVLLLVFTIGIIFFVILTIPNHRALSWNMLYKTPHWAYRSMIAKDHHDLVKVALIDAGINIFDKKSLLPFPVTINFVAHYKGQVVDCDNICTKLYIDGLKDILLIDDNPTYVTAVNSISVKDDKSYLVITIVPSSPRFDNTDIV